MTYENTFNERHYFKGFLGFQTDEFKNKSFGGSRNNYYYDGYEEMNHGDASSSMVNGNSSKLTMMSYFARFNYTFADKYLSLIHISSESFHGSEDVRFLPLCAGEAYGVQLYRIPPGESRELGECFGGRRGAKYAL